jgi:hypothetical protein
MYFVSIAGKQYIRNKLYPIPAINGIFVMFLRLQAFLPF